MYSCWIQTENRSCPSTGQKVVVIRKSSRLSPLSFYDHKPVELKVDPDSRTTGIALVAHFQKGRKVIRVAHLHHRGETVRLALEKRRPIRRSRRNRKTGYHPARFDHRRKPEGWLPPSLRSRVENVRNWAIRLMRWVPVRSIVVETVRFDTQKMQDPEMTGVEYQQGELTGYEVRQYLLEKWGHR